MTIIAYLPIILLLSSCALLHDSLSSIKAFTAFVKCASVKTPAIKHDFDSVLTSHKQASEKSFSSVGNRLFLSYALRMRSALRVILDKARFISYNYKL